MAELSDSQRAVAQAGLPSISVRNASSGVDGVDYEVIFKTASVYFAKPDNTVRRTQREFEWLCRQLGIDWFTVPFGESADPEADMCKLQELLFTLAVDACHQSSPVLRCFLCSPAPIPLSLSADELHTEEALLRDCTEDELEDKTMEELRDLCQRHGLSAVASFDDREYFVERIVVHSQKQHENDLDWLESAVESLGVGWEGDEEISITAQPTSTLCLREIEDALTSMTAVDDEDMAAAQQDDDDPLLARPPPLAPNADLPEDLLRALENPVAAAIDNLTSDLIDTAGTNDCIG